MGSVGSVTHCAQPIQRWNSERSGEISIRSATNGGFGQIESELCCGLGRHTVKAHGCGRTLEGSALHASKDFEAAPGIEGAQLADSSVCACGLGCSGEPHIDNNFGKVGDHVGTDASGDDSGIEGEPLGRTGERTDGDDLASGFDDGRGTAFEIESGVGGTAMDAHGVAGYALARSFASADGSGSGFKHAHGGGAKGEALGECLRSRAANLFVGNEQEGDGAGQRAEGEQSAQSKEGLDDSGFHVEYAGTGDASGVLAAGHGRQGAHGIDGVGVAEQEQSRGAAGAWEIYLQSRAVAGKFVLADARGERGEIRGDERDQRGDGLGCGGGGFLLDVSAEGGEHLGKLRVEGAKERG